MTKKYLFKKTVLLLALLFVGWSAMAQNYEVVGAGTAEANGIYVESGTYNSKPMYSNGNWVIAYQTGRPYYWGIAMSLSSLSSYTHYRITSTADTPPETGWVVGFGSAPAPTVILKPKVILYSTALFTESISNDGSISNSITITHNNGNDQTFDGTVFEDFVTTGKATVNNVPAGLTAQIILKDSLTAELSLTGNATLHTNAQDVTNLEVIFNDDAFTGSDPADVAQSTKSDIAVHFSSDILQVPSGYGTIASAIAAAQPYDIIQIAAGTYTEAGLTVDKELTFVGEAPNTTIIQAHANYDAASDRVFITDYGLETVKFYNLTIRHGKHTYAAGVFSKAAGISARCNLEMYNCIVTKNKSTEQQAAGIYCSGDLILNNCLISDNVVENGGDVWGSGLYFEGKVLLITNCTISGNIIELSNSLTSSSGAGIIASADIAKIVNTTISGNSCVGGDDTYGGGIKLTATEATLKNCIIYGNTATDGADIHTYDVDRTLNAYHCIIGNTATYSGGPAINGDNVNVTSSDPLLEALADNGGPSYTYGLQVGSPAINAGLEDDDTPDTDQRGFTACGTHDIGAFEFNGDNCQLISYNSTVFNESDNDDGSISNSITIAYSNDNEQAFDGTISEDFVATGKATVNNLPAGLAAQIVLTSSMTAEFRLTGNATEHGYANSITNLEVVFNDDAFTGGNAANITGSTTSNLEVQYSYILYVPSEYGTIAAAIAAAQAGAIIKIAAGTYTEAGLTVDKNLTFIGEDPATTIVQAAETYGTATDRVFYMSDLYRPEKAIFYNLTIQHGNPIATNVPSYGNGGGLYSFYTNIEMYNCIITKNKTAHNSSAAGGGLYVRGDFLILSDCLISDNELGAGSSGSNAIGGGAWFYGSNATVKNCTFTGNSINNPDGYKNYGAGMVCRSDVNNIINCTVTGSTITGGTNLWGGGICFEPHSNTDILNLKNCIIYGNTATDGADLYSYNISYNGTANAYNSIIGVTSASSGDFINGTSQNVTADDPLLGTLADNGGPTQTIALQEGSPAIDAGMTGDDIPNDDQRGYFANSTRDIGAFEYEGLWESSWNGTDWTNGTPDANADITLAGDLVTTGDIICKDLSISNNSVFVSSGDLITVTGNLLIGSGSKSKGTGELIIEPGASLTAQSNVENNGVLRVESDATGTGSLIMQGNYSGSGTYTVQRYLETADQYYYISPVISDAAANVEFSAAAALYARDVTADSWTSMDIGTATALTPGIGYAVKYVAGGTKVNYIGTPNLNNITPALEYKHGNTYSGFNLIGNPFSAAIDFENASINKTDLESATIWYPTTYNSSRTFATYNANSSVGTNTGQQYIPAGQGFWVRYYDAAWDSDQSGNITIPETAQTHNTQALYKENDYRTKLRIVLSDAQNTHETLILFDNEAKNQFDPYDSRLYAANSDVAELYSFAEASEIPLTINSFNSEELEREISLGFRVKNSGTYSLQLSELINLPANYEVILVDKLTGLEIPMYADQQYSFATESGDISTRFSLKISPKSTTGIEQVSEQQIRIYSIEKQVFVSTTDSDKYTVEIVNLQGKKLREFKQLSGNQTLETNLPTGLYLVYYLSVNQNNVQKIIIK